MFKSPLPLNFGDGIGKIAHSWLAFYVHCLGQHWRHWGYWHLGNIAEDAGDDPIIVPVSLQHLLMMAFALFVGSRPYHVGNELENFERSSCSLASKEPLILVQKKGVFLVFLKGPIVWYFQLFWLDLLLFLLDVLFN